MNWVLEHFTPKELTGGNKESDLSKTIGSECMTQKPWVSSSHVLRTDFLFILSILQLGSTVDS